MIEKGKIYIYRHHWNTLMILRQFMTYIRLKKLSE